MKEKATSVGTIVGRFQVPSLHSEHVRLIEHVCSKHQKVIIFLGLAPTLGTMNNPLDFESRKQMILEKFPEVNVLYIKDTKFDDAWSKKLDEQIRDVAPKSDVTLYGSRDSFIKHYTGKFPTLELEAESFISGSEIRRQVSSVVKKTADFRAGVIWSAYNRYPVCYPTVDIAIFNEDHTKILLGRKAVDGDKYRFVGGFAEPGDSTFEATAKREVMEETGIEVGDMVYIGSHKVDDWRYRGEVDKIKTLFFETVYLYGAPKGNDDIVEARWFPFTAELEDQLVNGHKPLFQMLLKKYNPTK